MGKHMKPIFYIGAILLLSCCPQNVISQRSIDPEIQKRIDDFIQDTYLPLSQISGMGLTIVQNNGEVLYTTGYGMADREKGIPNGNNTQFLIGSVTKSFTSVLTAKLLNERFPDMGDAVLDTPIRKLLPEVNFTLIDRFRSEQITFRNLLAHRVCLFREDLQLLADPFDTTEEIIYRSRYNEEICGVRSALQYNNQMYVMAGELAGVLANKSYADAMQDLLNELGMVNTSFVQRTDDYDQLPSRAKPYYVKIDETLPINTDLVQATNNVYARSHDICRRVNLSNAAGGLFVPPNDMARYMRFHLNLGNLDGKQIVPSSVMQSVSHPASVYPLFAFKQSDENLLVNQFAYGLGLVISTYDGWKYIQHGGYFPPYRSHMSLFPDSNLGIFTSTNMGPLMVDPIVLHAMIFETLQGTDNVTATEKVMKFHESLKKKTEEAKIANKKNYQAFHDSQIKKAAGVHNVAERVGKYGSGSAGEVEVLEKFNTETNSTGLYLQYGRWFKGWLEDFFEATIFRLDFDTDIVQDDYAAGASEPTSYVHFENDTLTIYSLAGDSSAALGSFKLGVSLDLLPTVPWDPESCGPK